MYDSFCDNAGVDTYIGCFEDEEYDRDFEELLSSSIYKPQECLDLAWEAGYIYAGIQAGSDCWGSSVTVGKHGAKDDCSYKCPNGQECGGQYSNSIYMFAFTKDEFCDATEYLEQVNVVGYNTDIITSAQATLTNPSGDGTNFIWEDKAGNSWTMEAVRKADGKIKGFFVGEECPYFDEWTYAALGVNPDGEYAVISAWPSAAEDFSIVYEFAEFGVGYAQEGKNWVAFEELVWSAYMYLEGSGAEANYGFWYTTDEDIVEFEYYDVNGAYCPATFDNTTSTLTLSNKFNSCPQADEGWATAYVTFDENEKPVSIVGPDGEDWTLFDTDAELLDAMYWTSYTYDSPEFSDEIYGTYLIPTDWETSLYYAYLDTYDPNFDYFAFYDSWGNICALETEWDAAYENPTGFIVSDYPGYEGYGYCPSDWSYATTGSDTTGDYFVGPYGDYMYVTSVSDFEAALTEYENSYYDYDSDSTCVNDDSVGDIDGDTCSGYYDSWPEDCGYYDTDSFVASEMCCACSDSSSSYDDYYYYDYYYYDYYYYDYYDYYYYDYYYYDYYYYDYYYYDYYYYDYYDYDYYDYYYYDYYDYYYYDYYYYDYYDYYYYDYYYYDYYDYYYYDYYYYDYYDYDYYDYYYYDYYDYYYYDYYYYDYYDYDYYDYYYYDYYDYYYYDYYYYDYYDYDYYDYYYYDYYDYYYYDYYYYDYYDYDYYDYYYYDYYDYYYYDYYYYDYYDYDYYDYYYYDYYDYYYYDYYYYDYYDYYYYDYYYYDYYDYDYYDYYYYDYYDYYYYDYYYYDYYDYDYYDYYYYDYYDYYYYDYYYYDYYDYYYYDYYYYDYYDYYYYDYYYYDYYYYDYYYYDYYDYDYYDYYYYDYYSYYYYYY